MTTPVLFLDDASRHVLAIDHAQAQRTAMAMIDTLKRLRKINKKIALNTAQPIAHCQISDEWTVQSIFGGTAFREEWDFIRMLNDRSPFASGLEEALRQEINGMEVRTRPGQILSIALAWATLLDSATVGFDAHPDWSRAWVDTTYMSLGDDGNVGEFEGKIRNVSQPAHADEHLDWLTQLGIPAASTAAQIWKERAERFPRLRFLPRTEKDLALLEGSGVPFLKAMSALESLARDAANWKPDSVWPDFSTKASPEGEQRSRFCWVIDDATGKNELFEWHTRFTGGLAGRIHFRVDAANRLIIVGYIGAKLTREISG